MLEVLRASVNTWECDQMGHLNVRHYFARASQGLSLLALQLGLPPAQLRAERRLLRPTDQHVRFHHELRPGAPFTVCAGVLEARSDVLRVYEELRAVASERVSATIVSDVRLLASGADGRESPIEFSLDVVQRARELYMPLPEHAQPRGVSVAPPRPAPERGDALAQRMIGAYLGPVLPEDCDASGHMLESNFMARISDGIGHFFRQVREGLRPDGVGGAALEYRYVYRALPRAGDLIEVRSCLTGLGRKTLHLGHAVFDVETGRCLATSEAIAVSFDLAARKSVEIPEDARAAMSQHIVSDFGA
jgi:acyl-CoA thioester hydrolase